MKKLLFVGLLSLILTSCTSAVPTEESIADGQTEILTLNTTITDLEKANKTAMDEVSDLKENLENLSDSYDVLEAQHEALLLEHDTLINDTKAGSSGSNNASPLNLVSTASDVLLALSLDDMTALASYVDQTNGLLLSPYQYIETTSITLYPSDIANLATLPTTYVWGTEPGSGDAIAMDAATYFDQYVYDEDYYVAPIVGQNIAVSYGNMINNITNVYPTASFVEFYYPQFDPQYGGMDWRSITLVFTDDLGTWTLLAIVHGEWTI